MRDRVVAVVVLAVVLALLLFAGGTALLGGAGPAGAPDGPERQAASGRRTAADPGAEGPADGAPDGPTGADLDGAEVDGLAGEPTDAELEARAKALAEDPNTQAICDLAIPVRQSQAYLAIGGHSDFNGRMVEVVNGKAYLPLVFDLGELGDATFDERSGSFSLEGYGPVTIEWSDPPADGSPAKCVATVEPELGRASLTGTITLSPSGAPAAGAWIEGCGNLAFADQSGVVHMDIVTDPCTVLAMRQDGMLRTVSEPVGVVPRPGEDVVVDLVIPEAPRGGLGVQLSVDEGGVRIDSVFEGSPADAAGLEPGDHVVAVDGAPVDPDDLGDFVSRVGGEAGTSVDLTVERGGEELQITLVREALPG